MVQVFQELLYSDLLQVFLYYFVMQFQGSSRSIPSVRQPEGEATDLTSLFNESWHETQNENIKLRERIHQLEQELNTEKTKIRHSSIDSSKSLLASINSFNTLQAKLSEKFEAFKKEITRDLNTK
jgi:predicted nuclease with TOPRIM domain